MLLIWEFLSTLIRCIHLKIGLTFSDPGTGRGHHQHVRTAGKNSKFGIISENIPRVAEIVNQLGATVIGLHAHSGSGILKDINNWLELANCLNDVRKYFKHARVLNVGGGLGVVQNPHTDDPLELSTITKYLQNFKNSHPDIELWMEPGRFPVAESGILLSKITQIKTKEENKRYIGINTGFNTLIRPILYNAYHHAVNLTRLHDDLIWNVDLVGMICESGDILGTNRNFPKSKEDDIVLITTTGAYGRSMSNEFNMRKPAEEYFLREGEGSGGLKAKV